MARVERLRARPSRKLALQSVEIVTQAQFMLRIYAEILAMDETIMERIRQLLVKELAQGDRDDSVANLKLVLTQLEKVGERISFWNGQVREVVARQVR
jgi:hypothetical protein